MGAPQHVLFNIFVHVVVTTRKRKAFVPSNTLLCRHIVQCNYYSAVVHSFKSSCRIKSINSGWDRLNDHQEWFCKLSVAVSVLYEGLHSMQCSLACISIIHIIISSIHTPRGEGWINDLRPQGGEWWPALPPTAWPACTLPRVGMYWVVHPSSRQCTDTIWLSSKVTLSDNPTISLQVTCEVQEIPLKLVHPAPQGNNLTANPGEQVGHCNDRKLHDDQQLHGNLQQDHG